jgi:hypothetical protein
MPFRGFCFLGLHKWGVWKPVENLSCTETIVCSACGDIKEARTVHKHKGLQWEYINDSCAQNGRCGKCGAIAESCVVRHDYQWVYLDESCKLHFSCMRCNAPYQPGFPDLTGYCHGKVDTPKIQHRNVVAFDDRESCVRARCANCNEILSFEHDWVRVDSETEYEWNPMPGTHHVDSDSTTYYYRCRRCPEEREEHVRSEWIVH